MKSRYPDISVLIATYNRAAMLRETLENMTLLDRSGVEAEFVVIDNNSSDATEEVVESFRERLAIRYVFEARPGKNCALNRALGEGGLGAVVVFTDDDVAPRADWLQAIKDVCARRREYHVFGGRIYPILPISSVAEWEQIEQEVGFLPLPVHDHGEAEIPYGPGEFPYGANLWVRREVLTQEVRFNEGHGPHPTNRISGSETAFLQQLAGKGYGFLYCPGAVVGHRVQGRSLELKFMGERAYEWGRGQAHFGGLPRAGWRGGHRFLWRLGRWVSLFKAVLWYGCSRVRLSGAARRRGRLGAIASMGYNLEALRQVGCASRADEQ